MILCLVASLTDFADGYVARLLKAESALGALLDPLADKFMLNALYLTLWLTRGIDLGALVLARDVIIVFGSLWVHLQTRRKDFPPSQWGKISTLFQMTWIVAYLGGWPGVEILGWCTIALTILSGLHYMSLGMKMIRDTQDLRN